MTEKERIERGTAEGFLRLHNQYCGSTFEIVDLSDAPDVRCVARAGDVLSLEITTTEDEYGDIQNLIGRSTHRNIETISQSADGMLSRRESPTFSPFDQVFRKLATRISSKQLNDHGNSVALVARDTSGCDWDWEDSVADICIDLDISQNPFDRGIWLLSKDRDKLTRISGPPV